MKILVTGAAGYLGSVLVPALLVAGHRVHALDRMSHGQGQALASCCANPRFDVTVGDARDKSVLKPLLHQVDAVIPLAAVVGAPACDLDQFAAFSTNLTAIGALAELMAPSQLMVIPVTNSGYGRSDAPCTETSPLRPVSLYGQTKVAAETIALDRENSISLRLATAFGASPRMRVDLMVNDFVYRAVNDHALVLFEGHYRRNFVHVADVARAFLHALANSDDMRGRPYNVGLDEANLTKRALCERIAALVPGFTFTEATVGSDPDQRDYVVSNARLAATGFAPIVGLDDGIAELVKLYAMLNDRRYRNA